MNRPRLATMFASFVAMSFLAANLAAEDKPAKTTDVKIQDITLKVPESWKQQEPSNRLRLAQFQLPKAEGDTVATELVVSSFGGGGGGIDQNLPRWVGEFAPDGREIKLTTGKSKLGDYTIADVKGTHVGSSFARRAQPLEDGRVLAVVLQVEDKGIYYLKVTGPEKSVAAQAEALRAAIGADIKAEKEYKSEKAE